MLLCIIAGLGDIRALDLALNEAMGLFGNRSPLGSGREGSFVF
jgi:hypothetical protein